MKLNIETKLLGLGGLAALAITALAASHTQIPEVLQLTATAFVTGGLGIASPKTIATDTADVEARLKALEKKEAAKTDSFIEEITKVVHTLGGVFSDTHPSTSTPSAPVVPIGVPIIAGQPGTPQ